MFSCFKNVDKDISYDINGDKLKCVRENGVANGKGIIYYKTGNRLECEIKNGVANGKGIHYWVNGNRLEGKWVNGTMKGKGIYYWISGNKLECEWLNGKVNGKGTFYFNNGHILDCEYNNGELIKRKSAIKDEKSKSSQTRCVVCFVNKRKVLFLSCKHDICCISCSNKLVNCPLCRMEISEKIDHY